MPDAPEARTLPNGKVFVIGGGGGTPVIDTAVELYDPNAGTWSSAASLPTYRYGYSVTMLTSGKILAAGGHNNNSPACFNGTCQIVEVFDPALASWSTTAPMLSARERHFSALLANGKVLVAGGRSINSCNGGILLSYPVTTSEIYDPAVATWSSTGTLAASRVDTTATLLKDGRVLVSGGTVNGMYNCGCGVCSPVDTASASIYDPGAGTWSDGPTMLAVRLGHSSTLLQDGRVLVVAGEATQSAAEVFDPLLNNWLSLPPTLTKHLYHTGTLLGNGDVLLAGGDALGSAELYKGQVAVGGPCKTTSQCPVGTCVDGFCCDAPCTGSCMACSALLKGQGEDGLCGPILALTDPSNECGTIGNPASTCYVPGYCNGAGACEKELGVECVPSTCAGQATQVNASTCDGNGTCVANGTSLCSPYLCQGTACLTSCATAADCAMGFICAAGVCTTPQANGLPCAVGAGCQSSFCADGVCCDTSCDGTCESCLGPKKVSGSSGNCGPVKADTDPDDECAADPAFPQSCGADGLCDGSGMCRGFAKSGTSCRPAGVPACKDAVTTDKSCDGKGTCVVTTTPCGGFSCDGDTMCKASCNSDTDCENGYHCSNAGICAPAAAATCADDHTVKGADGKLTDCKTYKCSVDHCLTTCMSIDDCTSSNICNGTNCVPQPAEGPVASDCGCSVPGDTENGTSSRVAVGFLALCLLAFRRRR